MNQKLQKFLYAAKQVVLAGGTAASGLMAWKTEQDARDLHGETDNQVKSDIANIYLPAATAIAGTALYDSMKTLVEVWPHLTNPQRVAAATLVMAGLVSAGYALSRANQGNTMIASALSYAASPLFFTAAKIVAEVSQENNPENERLNNNFRVN